MKSPGVSIFVAIFSILFLRPSTYADPIAELYYQGKVRY